LGVEKIIRSIVRLLLLGAVAVGGACADGSSGEPGIAFPFGALDEQPSSWAVLETEWKGEEVVIYWSSQYQGAATFRP
jgi:hypothetical protein